MEAAEEDLVGAAVLVEVAAAVVAVLRRAQAASAEQRSVAVRATTIVEARAS